MKKIAIIANEKKDEQYRLTKEVIVYLHGKSCVCYSSEKITGLSFGIPELLDCESIKDCDLILVIGGDGTMLHAIFEYAKYNIPFIGINIGRIGFLADLSPITYRDCMDRILDGDYVVDNRSTVCLKGKEINYGYALNEVMFRHRQGSGVGSFRVTIDQTFLSTYIGDGVLIAAPTGSTAYAFSLGGPIVKPSCDISIIQPLSPHSLNNRSVIVDSRETISVDFNSEDSVVYIDGMQIETNENHLTVEKGDQIVQFVRTKQYNFYSLLFEKLIQENLLRGEKE